MIIDFEKIQIPDAQSKNIHSLYRAARNIKYGIIPDPRPYNKSYPGLIISTYLGSKQAAKVGAKSKTGCSTYQLGIWINNTIASWNKHEYRPVLDKIKTGETLYLTNVPQKRGVDRWYRSNYVMYAIIQLNLLGIPEIDKLKKNNEQQKNNGVRA